MKKLEDIQVTFIWGGRAVTAFADVDYKTHKIDIGPMMHKEHVFTDAPYDMEVKRLELVYGNDPVPNPEEDMVEFAEQLLLEEADERLSLAW
jgi:hypothetical protein